MSKAVTLMQTAQKILMSALHTIFIIYVCLMEGANGGLVVKPPLASG